MGSNLVWLGTVVLLLAAAIAGGYLWLQRDYGPDGTPTEPKDLAQTERLKALREEVKEARKNVRSQERLYKQRVRGARRNLEKIQATGNKKLVSLNGKQGFVRLTPTEIQVAEGTFPVTASLTAVADVAGELIAKRRSTLTRMAAGGVLLGPLGVLLGAAAQKGHPR